MVKNTMDLIPVISSFSSSCLPVTSSVFEKSYWLITKLIELVCLLVTLSSVFKLWLREVFEIARCGKKKRMTCQSSTFHRKSHSLKCYQTFYCVFLYFSCSHNPGFKCNCPPLTHAHTLNTKNIDFIYTKKKVGLPSACDYWSSIGYFVGKPFQCIQITSADHIMLINKYHFHKPAWATVQENHVMLFVVF